MWTSASRASWTRWILLISSCSALWACGKEGPPRPPLPHLPAAPLAAVRQVGPVHEVFSAPAEAVTVRVEIRSRYALSLAAWHVQPPMLAPEADEAPAAADEAAS